MSGLDETLRVIDGLPKKANLWRFSPLMVLVFTMFGMGVCVISVVFFGLLANLAFGAG